MKTLLLDVASWDLTLDLFGNIALASDPYSMAQDAASRIKLFSGELWYDTTQGIPYWTMILAQTPPVAYLKAQFEAAAVLVPGVASATCDITGVLGRQVSGRVNITTDTGETATASF